MAIEKSVIVNVQTNGEKEIQSLIDQITKLEKEVEGLKGGVKDLNTQVDKTGPAAEKSGKQGAKGTSLLSNGFKAVGASIKAAGIGLVIAVIAGLTAAFAKNQRVMDAFNEIMGTISIVLSEVVDVFMDVYDAVASNSKNFDGLKAVIGSLITVALTPLKLSFYSIKLAVQEFNLWWEKSPFGGGDTKKIGELTYGILETKSAIADTLIDAGKATVSFVKNIGDAAGEIGNIVGQVVDGISKIDVAAAKAEAKRINGLKKSVAISIAIQAQLIEKYDIAAEKQRQIRDDESKSIEDRIEANKKLGKILDDKEKAMLAQVGLEVELARSIYAVNKSDENRIALLEAQGKIMGVQAQITGERSEQMVNENSLVKESIELAQLKLIGESNLSIEQKRFDAEREKDELKKIDMLKSIADEEHGIEKKRLEDLISGYADGTIAKQTAINELNKLEQDYSHSVIKFADDTAKAQQVIRNNQAADIQYDLDNKKMSFDEQRIAQKTMLDLMLQDTELTDQKRLELKRATADAVKKIDDEEASNKLKLYDAVGAGLQQLSSIVGEETGAGKAMAVAASLINTYAAIAGQLKAFSGVPIPGFAIAQAIVTGLAGFAAVKNILSVKVPGGGGGGGGGNSPKLNSSATAGIPKFSAVGTSNTNINSQAESTQTLSEQTKKPIKAYVVSSEVTTAQALDRQVQSKSTI